MGLGVHYQTIGYPERGEYSPSLYFALKIAEYFEVLVEVIFSTALSPHRKRRELGLIPGGHPQSL